MPRVKIERFPQRNCLDEIYQKTRMQFAFLSSPKSGMKQCHPFVLCRDFLQDVVKAHLDEGNCDIFGLKYNFGKNPPINISGMRMLVTREGLPDKDKLTFLKKLWNSKDLLNHYENTAGWSKTTILKVDDNSNNKKNHIWLFIGSKEWMRSSFLVSMFTYIIRLGAKEIKFSSNEELEEAYKELIKSSKMWVNGVKDNDLFYLGECWDKLFLIVKYNKELFSDDIKKNYAVADGMGSMHNYGGILSLCKFNAYDKEINVKLKEIHNREKEKDAKDKSRTTS